MTESVERHGCNGSSTSPLWQLLLLVDNDDANKDDCWFLNPSSSKVATPMFTDKQRLPSTLLPYFEDLNNYQVIRETYDTIISNILCEEQNATFAEIRAILRFIRLIATHSVQQQDGKEIYHMCISTLSKLTNHIIHNTTATSAILKYYIFYLHPIVLLGGKSFLLSPLWKGICDLLEIPMTSITEIVLPPLSEYFEKGHRALTQSLQNQTLKAVQNHIKLVSFFISRFTFIVSKEETIFENPQKPVRDILLALCHWKGIIYQQRKILTTSQNLLLLEALEVLGPKIDACLKEIVEISKINCPCFYPQPITIIMEPFTAASSSITKMESTSIGIILCLHLFRHQIVELPFYKIVHAEGSSGRQHIQDVQTDLQWMMQFCSTLLSSVTPFLFGTVMEEIDHNVSSTSQMWEFIVELLLLCMRKLSSSKDIKQMPFLFAKWCENSATLSLRNPLTRELTIHAISQHVVMLFNEDPSSSKALYLVYFFSKLIFSSSSRLQHVENLVEILIRILHYGAAGHNLTWLASTQYCICHVYLSSIHQQKQQSDANKGLIIFPLLECLPPSLFFPREKTKHDDSNILLPLKSYFLSDNKENFHYCQKKHTSSTTAAKNFDATNIPYGITVLIATLRSCHAGRDGQHKINEIQSKFQDYTGESLSSIVTLFLRSNTQACNVAVLATLLRFFSLVVKYQCLETPPFLPLIQWLEEVVTNNDTFTQGEAILQLEVLSILREIGTWIPLACEKSLLKVCACIKFIFFCSNHVIC
jgi:hypothetical protein